MGGRSGAPGYVFRSAHALVYQITYDGYSGDGAKRPRGNSRFDFMAPPLSTRSKPI